MAGPRLYGRVALDEVGPLRNALLGRPRDAITRVLTMPTPTPTVDRRTIAEAASSLVEQLTPLPGALHEIAIRIRRHCAAQRGQAKDVELAALLDALQDRTWGLSRAVWALTTAARPGKG
jgi:hypothetical protein